MICEIFLLDKIVVIKYFKKISKNKSYIFLNNNYIHLLLYIQTYITILRIQ